MRLVLATPLYPPEIGGPATHAKVIEEELPKRGIEVTLVKFGDVRGYPKGISHLIFFLRLFRAAWKADVLYALDAVSVGLPAVLAAKLARTRLVMRIAGDQAWEQGVQRFGITEHLDSFAGKHSGYPFWVRVMKKAQTFSARQAASIIVPSWYFKGIIEKWGVDPKKVHVVYSSYEPVEKTGNRAAIRSMLQFDGPLIISAGRLVPWKGFGALIEIMPVVRKQVPEARLIIAGGGPELRRLQARIHELDLQEAVSLMGALKQDTLLRYLEAADVFALNTGYEGLSHQLLEVMDVEVPIVTTRAGGNPELIDDGTSGLLVTYNDTKALSEAIVRILKNGKLAQHLAFHAAKKVKKFTREQMLEALIPLLR